MPPISVKVLDRSLEKFISKLQKPTISRILHTINLLEQFGAHLNLPHTKKIDTNLHELRIRSKQTVRIFYTLRPNQAILIHGFIKKTNKTPKKEITIATKKLKTILI